MSSIVILGGGIAGISAGYCLKQSGLSPKIYEKSGDWGGLCGNFTIEGFRFDRFVHFSFAEEPEKSFFEQSTELYKHIPFPSNYYKGFWLRHPAQNNLSPLPNAEKVKIISDFVSRPVKDVTEISNYGEWLHCQYGDYFAEHFPYPYTRKYWGKKPEDLGTKWVGQRMYVPDLTQVLTGAFETQDECFYYAKEMRYPTAGGYRSIFQKARDAVEIDFHKEAVAIAPKTKSLRFADGSTANYDTLMSSLPLPEIVAMLPDVPQTVADAAHNLEYTCGYQVSLGFRRHDIAKYLWFYIYDEDILSSRVYSPNLKSPDNAPEGCCSLQAEIFFSNNALIPDAKTVLSNTIDKMIQMGVFAADDIIVQDVRFEKYANVIFDHAIYKNRQIVLDYLASVSIITMGRFGKWDYLWSHQAFRDGHEEAKRVCAAQ